MDSGKETIAQRLTRLRKDHGFDTAADFGREHGINEGTQRSYENGNREVSKKAAKKLAGIFGVSESYILFGENASKASNRSLEKPAIADELHVAELSDGRLVHYSDLSTPTPIQDGLIVLAEIGEQALGLFEMSNIQGMDVLYPIDLKGVRGTAISYSSGNEWHTGTALIDGKPYSYRITGIARWISAPCNL